MQINISEIISTNFKKESYQIELEMPSFYCEGENYAFIDKQPVALTVENKGDSFVVISGTSDVTLDIPCNRCLKSVPTRIAFEFNHEIDFKKLKQEQTDDLDETSFIEESTLDVDGFVYNEIFMRLPMKTLCVEDCKGLCMHCGQNLNEGDCGCDRTPQDPRMSAIRDIFKNFKEV